MKRAMSYLLVACLCSLAACKASHGIHTARQVSFVNILLPPELADANQQFSGLCIANNKLYLLPECRLQEKQAAAIYAIDLPLLDKAVNGDSTPLIFEKIPVNGLALLRDKMNALNQQYEGTESIIVKDSDVYISVETNTPSANCYLLKGRLNNRQVDLDTSIMFPLRKPTTAKGERIYNAGFEAVLLQQKKLYCFFEYNSFPNGSFVYIVDPSLKNAPIDSVSISDLPFRITDATQTSAGTATAINFFYKGDGDDAVYRPAETSTSYKLVHDSAGYFNYSRLISLDLSKEKIGYNVIAEIPSQYWSYNWEGIAAYKGGYFIINDKYTDKRPYRSVLLYVKP